MSSNSRQLAARLVMRPRDTDGLGKVSGGVILSQIDLAAAVVARSACQSMRINRMVTRAMDRVEFKRPVYVNDVLTCYGTIQRIGRTSVTVLVEVEADRLGTIIPVTSATAVFVALDDNGNPTPLGCPAQQSGSESKSAPSSPPAPATDGSESGIGSGAATELSSERVIALRKVMMPNETNGMGNIFGGLLMDYMDMAGSYTASRACKNAFMARCVNRLMDKIEFKQPVHVNDVITCYGTITNLGTTSVTVHVDVEAERQGKVVQVTQADMIFVAVDKNDKSIPLACMQGKQKQSKSVSRKARSKSSKPKKNRGSCAF
ncbi:MAG: hypothetical protein K2X77_24595 [Candidatus Obscuribacterales bacterium]|nr:hypothetical protein [Candidatus Obscuribacterales bacterium]